MAETGIGRHDRAGLVPRRLDVVLVATLAFAADLPMFVWHFYPGHDLLESLSQFKYLYSGVLYDHALPQWNPLVFYGMRSSLLQFPVTPFGWVTGLAGVLTGTLDVARLLYLSFALGRMFFAVSLYYLSVSLYRTRLATVLVPSLGAVTIFWFFVPAFNLWSLVPLPLALLFFIRFFEVGQWRDLWRCGIVLAVSVMLPLVAPVLLLLFAAIGVALWLHRPLAPMRLAWPSAATAGLFLLCAGLLLVHGLVFTGAFEGLQVVSVGRGLDAAMALNTFLTYGVAPTLDTPAQAFILGYTPSPQWSSYIGLVPLAGALAAMIGSRRRVARGLAVGSMAILILANASEGAALAFHIPMMPYFRHLQHLYPVLKVLLVLLFGFAIDRFVVGMRSVETCRRWCAPWSVLLGWIGLFAVVDLVSGPLLRVPQAPGATLAFHLAYVRVAVYGVAALVVVLAMHGAVPLGWRRGRLAQWVLVGAMAFDVGSYQWQAVRQWPWDTTSDRQVLAAFEASPPHLPIEREREPADPQVVHTLGALASHAKAIKGTYYAITETLVPFDRCVPAGRVAYLAAGAVRLIEQRGGTLDSRGTGSRIPWDDRALMTVLGCGSPRFRLVSNAVAAGSEDELGRLLSAPDLDHTVVLTVAGNTLSDFAAGRPPVYGDVRLTHYEANALTFAVDNPAPYPVWLVYADAYDPGWRASVNGVAVPTFEAYGAFKAVAVPPGASQVDWRFHPGWTASAVIALRGLTGLGSLAALILLVSAPGLTWRFLRCAP